MCGKIKFGSRKAQGLPIELVVTLLATLAIIVVAISIYVLVINKSPSEANTFVSAFNPLNWFA